MEQEKKEKVGWVTLLVAGIGLGAGNLIFIFYCIALFFDTKFGYGAAVPAILLYIFANVTIIAIITEVVNWCTE